jgi:hypothetical protein
VSRLNSRACLLEMLAGDSSLNSRAHPLECSLGTAYISGTPDSSPFSGGVSNDFQGEQAQVCQRGRRGVHGNVEEATVIR